MTRLLLCVLCASVVACSSSHTTDPPVDALVSPLDAHAVPSDATPSKTARYDDTAQAVASTTAPTGGSSSLAVTVDGTTGGGDVASMAMAISIALGVTPPGFSMLAEGRVFGRRLGVDYRFLMTCKDALGVAGPCGPTTDQATVDVTWSGTQASTHADASIARSGIWTVTGLQSGTATFSGHSNLSSDAAMRSVFRPNVNAMFSFDAQTTYNAIQVSTQTHQILSGAATLQISAHDKTTDPSSGGDVDVTFQATAALTFQADQTAALVIDGTESYAINVATGAVARVY